MIKNIDEKDCTDIDAMGNDDGAMDGEKLEMLDANYSNNPVRYTKLDGSDKALADGADSWVMLRDNVTGLIWEMKTDDGTIHDKDSTYYWYDSNPATNGGNAGTPGDGNNTENYIKTLNDAKFGGFIDWRLPTMKELCTIIFEDMPPPWPTINTNYFPNTLSAFYWSSTTVAIYTDDAWGVGFTNGFDFYAHKYSGPRYVRVVRGGQSGSLGNLAIGLFDTVDSGYSDDVSSEAHIYTDNGDGTVTDTSTGLVWQQAGSTNEMIWEQALAYCARLNLGGYTDWRLPTIKELRSLVDYNCYKPAINTTYFPGTVSSFYWSSTTYAGNTLFAWGVKFHYGDGFCIQKGYHKYVRAVRGGQPGSLDHSVISVSPDSRAVAKDAGTTTFSVSKTGLGTMPWTAAVTSGGSWLSITSGVSCSNSGTITCRFTTNIRTSARTATIRIIATGGAGSQTDVKLTQAGQINHLQHRRRNDKNRRQRQLQRVRTL